MEKKILTKINSIMIKRVIVSVVCIWFTMSIFLSIKVYIWEKDAYENYGLNNQYKDIMKDEFYARLSVRDYPEEEIAEDEDIFIPIALWYGSKTKNE